MLKKLVIWKIFFVFWGCLVLVDWFIFIFMVYFLGEVVGEFFFFFFKVGEEGEEESVLGLGRMLVTIWIFYI